MTMETATETVTETVTETINEDYQMNDIKAVYGITETRYGNDIAYTLSGDALFSETEYKVLMHMKEGIFVRMMKIRFNGKIQLYYMTNGYRSLREASGELDEKGLMTIADALIDNINEAKRNGFLDIRNIDMSPGHIFIDLNSLNAMFIYLPAEVHFFNNDTEAEAALIKGLTKCFNGRRDTKIENSEDYEKLFLNKIRSFSYDEGTKEKRSNECINNKRFSNDSFYEMRLEALGINDRCTVNITKDDFLIGKKADAVDGRISFNNMISRVHCRINKTGNSYLVTDLESANGTFINGMRLISNKAFPVKDGDILRLANSEFRIRIL